jgi:hypothetical protein
MLRWRDTARKVTGNKDKINTLSRVNGSMPAVLFAEAASAFRLAGAVVQDLLSSPPFSRNRMMRLGRQAQYFP